MCVVALAYRVHPDWPIILIGNRDEFHARPAAPLHAWDDGSGIVAGRDLQAGGTWLGVHTQSGRAVVVTNVRGAMPDPAKDSRGAIVTGPSPACSSTGCPRIKDSTETSSVVGVLWGAK